MTTLIPTVGMYILNDYVKPADVYKRIEQIQPSVVRVMDGIDLARALVRDFPGMMVMHRRWRPDDAELFLKISASEFFETIARDSAGGIIPEVGNEPDPYVQTTRQMAWYAEIGLTTSDLAELAYINFQMMVLIQQKLPHVVKMAHMPQVL